MSMKERRRSETRLGWVLLIGSALALVAMMYGAASVDASHGISVAQSLQAWGL